MVAGKRHPTSPCVVAVRSRIVRLAVIASVLAIALFAVPFAAGVARYYVTSERTDLEGDAEAAASAISASLASTRLPTGVDPIAPETPAAVYDMNGVRVAGDGPPGLDPELGEALSGRVRQATIARRFVVAMPLVAGERQAGVLRASRSDTRVWERTALTWAVMLALAAAAALATWAVARRLARRMADPLEQLVHQAERLGDGDFTVRARATGIEEIDALGRAQEATAARLSELVARERAFSAEASHQLRTPLAGLRLQLEDAATRPDGRLGSALTDALTTTDRLHRTVEDLLRLARDRRPPAASIDVAEVVGAVVEDHAGTLTRGHRVECDEPGLSAAASDAALRQILAVLLENATAHGTGRVTVTVRPAGTAVAIDVADEGHLEVPESALFARRPTDGAGHGIGLSLARRLAEAEGGRLRLRFSSPTTFTLLLPGVPGIGTAAMPQDGVPPTADRQAPT
jgi:signal transduction histidine kinase